MNIQRQIIKYKLKIEDFKDECKSKNIKQLEEIYKSIMIRFLEDVVKNYNNLKEILCELNNQKTLNKISKLNMLLKVLKNEDNNDGTILGIDCNRVIMDGYIKYFYLKFRDAMLEWDLSSIKKINEKSIKNVVMNSAAEENIVDKVDNYMDILTEVVLMLNKIEDKELLNVIYKLNLMNRLIDVYLLKKESKLS